MNFLDLIIFALATWRISTMLVREDGPFFVFKKIREISGITHDQVGRVLTVPDRLFAGLLSCVWCTSVWVSGIWIVLWIALPSPIILVATLFSLSSLAIAFDQLFNRLNQR